MRTKFFKLKKIDQEIVVDFLNRHEKMKRWLPSDEPFSIRVCVKPYAGLIHAIISQNEDNENVINIAEKLSNAVNAKIDPKHLSMLNDDQLFEIFNNKDKVNVVKQITNDLNTKKWKIKKLIKLDTKSIIQFLVTTYPAIDIKTAKEFALFTCFKPDVLCSEDEDFIIGLELFLDESNISKDDIEIINQEYNYEQTLFSFCMWKIRFAKRNEEQKNENK